MKAYTLRVRGRHYQYTSRSDLLRIYVRLSIKDPQAARRLKTLMDDMSAAGVNGNVVPIDKVG